MGNRLEGYTALVTGASRGVGKGIALELARAGCRVAVNYAGVQTWQPLLDVSESDWDRVINTNLKGTFLCTQFAAKHMKECGGGAIVNIGSGCNKLPFPNLIAYTASKGGVEMFTRVAAVELGPHRIRV